MTGLFSTVRWEDFPTTAEEGIPTAALNPPISSPPADRPHHCLINLGIVPGTDATSVISFTGVAECVLTVVMEKEGYNPLSRDFSVTAVGVFDSLTWPAFPSVIPLRKIRL